MKKRNNISTIALIIALALTVLVATLYTYTRLIELNKESSNSISALKTYVTGNMRTGYRAVMDIDAGAMITEGMLEYSAAIVSDVDQSQFITSGDIGKVATVSIRAGVPLISDMVSAKLASDYKERECTFIWLNTNPELFMPIGK